MFSIQVSFVKLKKEERWKDKNKTVPAVCLRSPNKYLVQQNTTAITTEIKYFILFFGEKANHNNSNKMNNMQSYDDVSIEDA